LVTGKTVTSETVTLKENESDTSNDGSEQQTTKSIVRTDNNNSDEASGYFTEECVNISDEDVSTLLPPVTMDHPPSQADNDSSYESSSSRSSSNSSTELKPGMTHLTGDAIIDAARMKLKTSVVSSVAERQAIESDNTTKPSEYSCSYNCVFKLLHYFYI